MKQNGLSKPAHLAAFGFATVTAFCLGLPVDTPRPGRLLPFGWEAFAQASGTAPTPVSDKNKKADKPAAKQQDKAAPKDASPAPTLPAGEPIQAPEYQALDHARQAGLTTCTDTLARILPLTIDGPNEAFSFWAPAPEKADERLFASIAGLRYVQQAAPRAAAVVGAVPTRNGKCDALGVQVVPSARSCGTLQASLLGKGKAVANLTGLPLIESPNGQRFLLLPSAGNGCVIVAVSAVSGR